MNSISRLQPHTTFSKRTPAAASATTLSTTTKTVTIADSLVNLFSGFTFQVQSVGSTLCSCIETPKPCVIVTASATTTPTKPITTTTSVVFINNIYHECSSRRIFRSVTNNHNRYIRCGYHRSFYNKHHHHLCVGDGHTIYPVHHNHDRYRTRNNIHSMPCGLFEWKW